MDKIDGRYLRDLREKHGYSLRAFSEKIFVSKSTVQRWEKSYLPEQIETLEKIAETFGITVEELSMQAQLKYGKTLKADETSDSAELSPEQLSEIKFGAKKLIIPIIFLFALGVIITFLTLLL